MRRLLGIALIAGLLLLLVVRTIIKPAPVQVSPQTLEPPPTPVLSHAPRFQPGPSSVDTEPAELELQPTNAIGRILREEDRKLTLEQVEPYLARSRRSAESLYAAFQTTGDRKFLQEAMQKFPNDPKITLTAATMASPTPEEHRQWLDAFKQADPNNALGNYLSAQDYLKSGQTDKAVQELMAASGKSRWQDYAIDSAQNAEDAFLAAGVPAVEAKGFSFGGTLLPDLAPLKQLGVGLTDLAQTYQQAGDTASAQAALQMAATIGQNISGPSQEPLITTLVGLSIENKALAAMDPAAPYGNSGQTVADRINAIAQQRTDLKALSQQFSGVLPTLSEPDLIGFYDRQKTFGAIPAMRWVMGRNRGQ